MILDFMKNYKFDLKVFNKLKNYYVKIVLRNKGKKGWVFVGFLENN